jgi:hypothetical protein
MLLKRFDVTIQSFLWGSSAQSNSAIQDEMVCSIREQQQYLTETPTHYQVYYYICIFSVIMYF